MPTPRRPLTAPADPGASREKRAWVRLTRACNNGCLFCLDADCQDGSVVPRGQVLAEARRGLREGASRLVLSGGEPTIHPDFVGIVRGAARLGYRWVQVISNGRAFAYRGFARRAVAAGVREVTVSIHGGTDELHDGLTRVPGSLRQSLAGIRNLLETGGCHVSADVVVNARNAGQLAETVERIAGAGVREVDLLFVQPFGRAGETAGLLLDERAAPLVRRGVRRGIALGCRVWTNRVPPAFLEGMEEAIQAPGKLLDDVAGRRELLGACVARGTRPACAGTRCAFCVLEGYCRRLLATMDALRGEPGDARRPLRLLVGAGDGAADLERLARLAPPGGPIDLELAEGADPAAARALLPGRIVRAWAAPGGLAGLGFLPGRCARVAVAQRGGGAASLPPGVRKVALVPRGDIAEERERGPDIRRLARDYPRHELIDVPPCLAAGRARRSPPLLLHAGLLDDKLRLDPLRFAETFVERLYCVKSLRCRACAAARRCGGIHVNHARIFGLRILRPMDHIERNRPNEET